MKIWKKVGKKKVQKAKSNMKWTSGYALCMGTFTNVLDEQKYN